MNIEDNSTVSRVPGTFDITERLWALFASTKLALGLLLTIAIAALAGALIMQAPTEIARTPDALNAWIERARPRYGLFTDLFRALGLFTVFQAVWFKALLALLAVNTVVCTTNRLPKIWRQVFHPTVWPRDALFERGHPRVEAQILDHDLAAAAITVRKALQQSRFRVVEKVTEDGRYMAADRDRLARFGTLFSHSALVLILAGVVVSEPLGSFEIPDFTVPIGSVREVGRQTGLSVRVEDFADEYYLDGRPKDYRSAVVLLDGGREVARSTVRVNEPLIFNGVRFHQSFYGSAAAVAVVDGNGATVFRDAVSLAWRSNDGQRPVGYFYLPGRDLHVYLVGTAGQGDTVIKPGELVVEAYQGVTSRPSHRVTLTQNQPLAVGDLQFLFERELPFTGLRVVRDPGAPIVWIACVMLIVGFALAFYFPYRQVWARLRLSPTGLTVALVGAGKETADELHRIARRIAAEPKTRSIGDIPQRDRAKRSHRPVGRQVLEHAGVRGSHGR